MNQKYDLDGLSVDWPVESLLTTYTKNDATMVDITSYGVHTPNPLASLNRVSAKASDGYIGLMFPVCYPVVYCITVLSCFSVLCSCFFTSIKSAIIPLLSLLASKIFSDLCTLLQRR